MTSLGIKLILIIIFGIVGTLIYIVIKLNNSYMKNKGKRLVKKLNSDAKFVHDFSQEMEFMYAKCDASLITSESKLFKTQSEFSLDMHKVILTKKLNTGEYLLVTSCTDKDYDFTIGGKMGDVDKVYQLNYLLKIGRSDNIAKIYSNLFSEKRDKELRENFSKELFKFLTD